MSTFFNDWSNLANQPQDVAQRQVVIQDGISLTQQFNDTSTQLTSIESQIDAQINSDAQNANNLAQKIADLNGQIVVSQGSGDGHPNDLMDQRDADLKQLSQLLNVNTVHQENGAINVYVGSEPLVIGTQNQGIAVQTTTVNGKAVPSLVFKSNNGPVPATSGELGGLLGTRAQADSIITQTNTLAGNLIFELNKLHASGQGTSPITSATATNGVSDVNAALNTAGAGLKFQPVNGSFVVHVQNASGQETSTLVKVDLDGLNNNDTTLTSLAASLNAITGVSATITGGKLTVAAANGASGISFSQDSSGVVAALGINTFFSGNDASNIAVNLALQTQPGLLAAAQNGDAADNTNALAIASLGSTPIASMNGSSLDDSYQSIVNGIATQVSDAKTNTQASSAVLSALSAQHDSTSGVSLDEEAVNLMQQQRAFQGAARLITTIDQMMQTLINM
jgi:flagellar hook-associated protein 1 FlgK